MANKKEFIKPLELSTLVKPTLKQMGLDAILLVTFDIIIGPVAYVHKFRKKKSEYLDFLQDLSHLGEFYTGIAHAQIEKITTNTEEELLISRAVRKVNETELTDLAVAIVNDQTFQKEILKMLQFAVKTCYGNPENFSKQIERVVLNYQKNELAEKIANNGEKKKDFKKVKEEKVENLRGKFENWDGIMLVDFETSKINDAFMPDWIAAHKVNPIELAQETSEKYERGEIDLRKEQKFAIISRKGKQIMILANQKMKIVTILYPTITGLTNITNIARAFELLNEAISESGVNIENESLEKTLEYLDRKIMEKEEGEILKEILAIMLRAGELMPKKELTLEEYELFEGEMQKQFFKNFGQAYQEFDGTKTIRELAFKTNIPVEKLSDFIKYCMTRGIIKVFTKNGRKSKSNGRVMATDGPKKSAKA
ncbi:MAG: hypothetical protein GF308_14625 [Candidatus Heimdallarchaeota archaeon]|nr:hypothetical protein [Candidatus Heimdallarchaeota archaeon]